MCTLLKKVKTRKIHLQIATYLALSIKPEVPCYNSNGIDRHKLLSDDVIAKLAGRHRGL